MRPRKKLLTFLLLFLPLLLLSLCLQKNGRQNQMFEVIPERWKNKRALIIAIARHETGNFNSNVFKQCNNAFGLKTKVKTKCPAPASEGVGLYYRHFATPGMSVLAFIEWLERRAITPDLSDEEILVRMGRAGYYTDKDYIKKVKKWI